MPAIELRNNVEGHWVTIDGNHVLIKDPIGGGQGFTRAALHRKLIEYHAAVGGERSGAEEEELRNAAGGDPWTFRDKLPTEVREYLEGRNELRPYIRVAKPDDKGAYLGAAGSDALGHAGDRYFTQLERMAGHNIPAALEAAHSSNDPEMQFVAAIHDNLPPRGERSKQGAIDAKRLKVGAEFTIHGSAFRVVENEHGYRVLSGPSGFPEDVPLDALTKVPVDRGSLRQGSTKPKRGDAIPFSRDAMPYYLSTAAPAELAPIDPPPGYPEFMEVKVGADVRRVPCGYFWKDAIAVGDYVHPATKQRLNVSADRIDAWVGKFKEMRAAAIDIPTPVDHKGGADSNRGFVIDARRDGDRLKLLHQTIGEDAALTALRNRCSLCIDPDYRDERGRAWGDCFTHNAYTPTPVVTGMGSFVPFLASRAGEGQTPVFYAAAVTERSPEMDLKPLREKLGIAADQPDEKIIDAVASLLAGKATADAKVTELTGTVAQLSRAPAAPDPVILADRNESKRERIELSMARGDMPKVVADRLLALLPADKPSVFMLSRADGLDATPIDLILGLFKDAKAGVATGSETGVQLLHRTVPGEGQGSGAAKTPAQQAAESAAVRENLARTPLGRRALAEMDAKAK